MPTFLEQRYRRQHLRCVRHITLDPKGRGAVRIHMIPPREDAPSAPFLLLLNGDKLVPLNLSWAILLANFMDRLEPFAGLGVRYATCSGLIPSGSAEGAESRATRLTEQGLTDVLRAAAPAVEELGMELDFTSPGWLPEETLRALGLHLIPSCGACLSNMAVAPDGSVIPCQSWLSSASLGNILTDDWSAIWNSQRCAAIRAESAKMAHICQLRTGNREEGATC